MVARVITIVSRASSAVTTPRPREANRPSVDSRTITKVDRGGARVGERRGHARDGADGADPGIELKMLA